jgi:hypothetical protein
MNKHFPWGIFLSLSTIVAISFGGAYLIYRILDGPDPFKTIERTPGKMTPVTTPVRTASAADTDGYLVIHLRASVEMSPDTGVPAFDMALENKGFSAECPGKVVSSDHRAQGKDYWTEEEGALASADSLVCLPATSKAVPVAVTNEVSEAAVMLDEEDAAQFPSAVLEAKGQAVFIQTGKAGYLLYAGGISAKSCATGCGAGAAAGVSVTRMSRALSEDRFVFNVPAGDSQTLDVVTIVPVTR